MGMGFTRGSEGAGGSGLGVSEFGGGCGSWMGS